MKPKDRSKRKKRNVLKELLKKHLGNWPKPQKEPTSQTKKVSA